MCLSGDAGACWGVTALEIRGMLYSFMVRAWSVGSLGRGLEPWNSYRVGGTGQGQLRSLGRTCYLSRVIIIEQQ